jgi:2-dehydropantoate 2-reductase
MMNKITIVGCGAIGALLAARLSRAGVHISVIDQGAQLEAIQRNGITVHEEGASYTETVFATGSPSDLGEQDLVFVCLKGQTLSLVAKTLRPLIGPQTKIVSVMNGIPWWFLHDFGGKLAGQVLSAVDPAGTVSHALPCSQSLGCVVQLSSAVSDPGVIRKGAGNRLVIGSATRGATEKSEEVATMLQRAGFDASPTDDIRRAIWLKLWGNMTMNPISALTRSKSDVILDDPLTEAVAVSIMEEARQVGREYGIAIDTSTAERNAMTRNLGSFKTSMLQDVEGHRSLEVDALLAAPYELAQMAGVPTPWLASIFAMIRQLDRNLAAARALLVPPIQ